jgi:crotonobetainyl-CoA:carnitine CoA-transferase CaiB-like acyl-CoA transferase
VGLLVVPLQLALVPMLQAVLMRWTRGDILAALEEAGVPAGPINGIDDVFADPQVQARGMQIAHGSIPGVRMPILFDGAPMVAERPCPRLGEHTDEVLAGLGDA